MAKKNAQYIVKNKLFIFLVAVVFETTGNLVLKLDLPVLWGLLESNKFAQISVSAIK